MIKKKAIRLCLGVLLGACAGLSLTSSILPTVLSSLGVAESFLIRWSLSGYAAHCVLLWAIGGWTVARTGSPKAGAIIMGLLGLASGTLLTFASFGTGVQLLLAGGGGAAAYGLTTGLLLGNILRPSEETSGVLVES